MKYSLIVTPKNVNSRIYTGLLLVFAGCVFVAVAPGSRTLILGLMTVILGCIVSLYGWFWFCRLYLVAWFK